MKEDRFFFTHDYHARNDLKVKRVRTRFGAAGYAVYFMLLEILYEESGRIAVEDIEVCADDMRVEESMLRSVVHDFDLFKTDGVWIWSESVLRRLEMRAEKSRKNQAAALGRWKSKPEEPKEPQTSPQQEPAPPLSAETPALSAGETPKETTAARTKKTKQPPPELKEVTEYFISNGYAEAAGKKAYEYYALSGWKDSKGNPVLNWKQKMLAVWFKPENMVTKPELLPSYWNGQRPTASSFGINESENKW